MKPITGAVLAGFMRVHSDAVNMVNAPFLAKERGLDVREIRHDRETDYHTLLRVSAMTSAGDRPVVGTLFANSTPRLVEIFGIRVEAELEGEMIYIVNEDTPRLHRPARHPARGAGRQYRHLQPRPPRGGGRGRRPGLRGRPYRPELVARLRPCRGSRR
jgi:D-3-phosphoglycerate dehydrogenase